MALSVADAGWVTKGGGQKPIVRREFTAETPNFHIPASLDTWFMKPHKGHYKSAEHHIDIENPDYSVTWDVVKKKDDMEEG